MFRICFTPDGEEIRETARRTELYDDIMALTGGFDTEVARLYAEENKTGT